MSKIKKYTIDEEIPKNVKASDLLKTVEEFIDCKSAGVLNAVGVEKRIVFYFLVEEESERKITTTLLATKFDSEKSEEEINNNERVSVYNKFKRHFNGFGGTLGFTLSDIADIINRKI